LGLIGYHVVERSFPGLPRTERQGSQRRCRVAHDVGGDQGESTVGALMAGQPPARIVVPQGEGGEGGGLRLRRHSRPRSEPTVAPGGGKARRGSREQAGAHAGIIGVVGEVLDHPVLARRGFARPA